MDVIAEMKRELELAARLRFADRRAHQLVDMAVAYALNERREEPDEGDYRRFAADVALDATACLIRTIYGNDSELKALRQERDELKKMVEDYVLRTPFQENIRILTKGLTND